MTEIQYVGEHLLPAQLGRILILLGFVSAILSTVGFFLATQQRGMASAAGWRTIGRIAFGVHAASIFTVIGTIFYVMAQQYYEYQYVQAHVSEELPMEYIFSAFWEGQEGSFLLWMFWHIVLGLVLMVTAKAWETPVMAVVASVQIFVTSMILGVYFGFGDSLVKIGSNPLMLLRDVMDAPIFRQADYTTLIKGNGLNPLLQNYWMTIHPPTLFLGFASTVVPFAYAVAGLWLNEHKTWLRPALQWSLFSGAILGTGILMGGAWAYEALSFGGYWAWDPVENSSLVPWLTLLAGIHTNLVARATGHSIRSTYAFYLMSFILILYSTTLTRSGLLGDTSVHAFTEMGLGNQLFLFIGFYIALSIGLYFWRSKSVPAPEKEESASSKEFWMFIGALVLLFSAMLITGSTSLPVYNKIRQAFDPDYLGRVITDPIAHYNKYQLWIGVFMGLLSGGAQFLRFREVNFASRWQKYALHTGAALVISAALTWWATTWIDAHAWQYALLLFSGIFTVVSNLDYLVTFLRGNLKLGGSTLSHIGFGVMIVGVLASSLNKRFISTNPFIMEGLIEGADEERLRNNILLFKNSPMIMQGYEVTYTSDTLDQFTRTFTVNYKKRTKEGTVTEEFDLYPNVLYDKTFTKIASSNPSTKHYLNRDVFTHIASLPQVEMDVEYRRQREDSLKYRELNLVEGQATSFLDTLKIRDKDTFVLKKVSVEMGTVNLNPRHPEYEPKPGDFALGAQVRITREGEDSVFVAEPVLVLRDELLYTYPVQINDLSTRVRLNEKVFEQFFITEEQLSYQEHKMKRGDVVEVGGLRVTFTGFNPKPQHPGYQAKEGDIAVGAILDVQDAAGRSFRAQPLYFIRDNQPFNLKDVQPAIGLHTRFESLDPATESMTLSIAKAPANDGRVPIDIATNSLRSDYIVLEAIEFPGINYFWLGSILMMIGLSVSFAHRVAQRKMADA